MPLSYYKTGKHVPPFFDRTKKAFWIDCGRPYAQACPELWFLDQWRPKLRERLAHLVGLPLHEPCHLT